MKVFSTEKFIEDTKTLKDKKIIHEAIEGFCKECEGLQSHEIDYTVSERWFVEK